MKAFAYKQQKRNLSLGACLVAFVAQPIYAKSAEAKEWSAYTVRVDEIAEDYASCIVDHYPKITDIVVRENLSESEIFREYDYLVDGKCYQTFLSNPEGKAYGYVPAVADRAVYFEWLFKGFTGSTLPRAPQIAFKALRPDDNIRTKVHRSFYLMPGAFKGGLAQAMLRRETVLQFLVKEELEGVAPLQHRAFPNRASNDGRAEQEREGALFEAAGEFAAAFNERLGECISRMNPNASRDFVLSSLDSAEESVAVQKLLPGLGACLPPDEPFKLDKTDLRNGTAISLYRLLKGAQR